MTTAFFWLVAIALLVAAYPVLEAAVDTYRKLRGKRLVTCPETKAPAAVELDARHAGFDAALGKSSLRVKECSRWPERKDCGQGCLREIESAPAECLVRKVLTTWYEGSACVLCGKPLGESRWPEHKPALMSRDHKTTEWGEVPPERLPEVFSNHWPVCWNCHIAESFRRRFPDLVIDNPWKLEPARDKNE